MKLALSLKAIDLMITGVMGAGVVGAATTIAVVNNNQSEPETAEIVEETEEDNGLSEELEPAVEETAEPNPEPTEEAITTNAAKPATPPANNAKPSSSDAPKQYSQSELISTYSGTCPKDIPADIFAQQQKVFWVQTAAEIDPFVQRNIFSNEDTITNIIQSLFYSSALGDDYNYTLSYTAWQLKVKFESFATKYTITYNAEHGYPYTSPMYDFGASPTIYPDAGINLKQNNATRTISWYYADFRDGAKYPLSAEEVARVEALTNRLTNGWQGLYNQYVAKCGTSLR